MVILTVGKSLDSLSSSVQVSGTTLTIANAHISQPSSQPSTPLGRSHGGGSNASKRGKDARVVTSRFLTRFTSRYAEGSRNLSRGLSSSCYRHKHCHSVMASWAFASTSNT